MTSKTNNNNAKNSQDAKKKFNPLSGGRCLNAIRHSNLTPTQKHILIELTSQMDFTSDFLSPVQITKSRLAKFTGYNRETIVRNLLDLESKEYVMQNTEPGRVSKISLTSKLFDEFKAKMTCDPRSQAQNDLRSKVTGGVILDHRGCDLKSILFSLSYPFLFPFNLNAPLLDIMTCVNHGRVTFTTIDNKQAGDTESLGSDRESPANNAGDTESQPVVSDGGYVDAGQNEPQDKVDARLSQKGGRMVPIADHPLTAVLKESSQKRKAEKAAKSNATAAIEKTVSDTTRKPSEDAETLFKSFQSHFRGGSGRFCYKAQRLFWARVVQDDLVEEAKATLTFFHGVDKPTAQVAAGNKRMSDEDYVNFLYEEALGIRARKEKDRKDQEDIERERKERQEIINSLTPEEKARREEKLLNMKRMLKNVHHYKP